MGMISEYTTRSGISLPAAYHRVQNPITVDGGTVTAVVATYVSVEDYVAGRAMVEGRPVRAAFDPEAPVHQLIYAAAKALPEFAGAVDHTEPLTVAPAPLPDDRAAEMRSRDIPPWASVINRS